MQTFIFFSSPKVTPGQPPPPTPAGWVSFLAEEGEGEIGKALPENVPSAESCRRRVELPPLLP